MIRNNRIKRPGSALPLLLQNSVFAQHMQHSTHLTAQSRLTSLQKLQPRLLLTSLQINKKHLAPTATTADLPHTALRMQPLHACPAHAGQSTSSGAVKRPAHSLSSGRCGSCMSAYPPQALGEKGAQEQQAKVMATTGLKPEGPTATHKLPHTKATFLERPNCPSSPIDASGPRACNLSTFTSPCLTACFSDSKISPSSPSSAPPAQKPTCPLHHPDSCRHLNQLPAICCPPAQCSSSTQDPP